MSLWVKSWSVTIQMKATEQYFPVVFFIMLYKVVLTFESVGEILKCDHSNESYWAVLSCGTVYGLMNSLYYLAFKLSPLDGGVELHAGAYYETWVRQGLNREGGLKRAFTVTLIRFSYTYRLSRLRRDSHAWESKTLISRQITPAD